ncbi:MAG: O-antigen ligase family protein [Planctomycetaceae bacterium]|nr:O-antigen ligase family protein [Planctomycetaceae bacterium]
MKSEASAKVSEDSAFPRFWLFCFLSLFASAWFLPTEATLRGGLGMPTNLLWCVWLAALFGYGAVLAKHQPFAWSWEWQWADRLWLAYLLWYTLSVLLGCYFQWLEPRPALGLMWQQVTMAAIYISGRLLFRSEAGRVLIVGLMVALGLSLSFFAWYQYLVALPELHQQYRSASEAEKVRQLIGAGILDTQPGSRMRELFESRLFNREPFGPFSLTNTLAAVLVPAALLAAIRALETFRFRKWRSVGLWGSAAVLLATTMALTSSRTSALAFGLTLLLWTASRFRFGNGGPWTGRFAWGAMATLVLLPVLLVVGLWAMGRSDSQLFSGAPQSVQYRLQYWVSSSQMIAARPWFGWGPGNFQSAYAAFQSPAASETVADPHNFFFEISASAGLPAGLVFMAAVALSIFCWPASSKSRQIPKQIAAAMQAEGVASPARCRAADFNDWCGKIWPGLSIGVGLGIGLAISWLGESTLSPVFWMAMAVLLSIGWFVVLRFIELPVEEEGLGLPADQQNTSAPRWALVGLLLSLLASGGVGYPVIGSCLMILAALSVPVRESRLASAPSKTVSISNQNQVTSLRLAAIGLACLAGYMYLYQTVPVIRSEWAMQRGRAHLAVGNMKAGQHELEMAKRMDPWRGDAQVESAVLALLGHKEDWDDVKIQTEVMRKFQTAAAIRPTSSSTRRRLAEAYLQAAAVSRDAKQRQTFLGLANEWLQQAAERKPVDAGLLAQCSWMQHTLGGATQARELARQVERLGLVNRHADLQLDQQWFLAVESEIPESLRGECRPIPGSSGLIQVNVAVWIRWLSAQPVTAK